VHALSIDRIRFWAQFIDAFNEVSSVTDIKEIIADLNTPPNVPRRLREYGLLTSLNQQKIWKSTLSFYKTDRSFIGE
jgi:hypothetical protein